MEHRIPDVLGGEEQRYENKLTMVVGAGASAATVLQSLKALGTTEVSCNVKTKGLTFLNRLFGSPGGRVNRMLYKKEILCLRGKNFTNLAILWLLLER